MGDGLDKVPSQHWQPPEKGLPALNKILIQPRNPPAPPCPTPRFFGQLRYFCLPCVVLFVRFLSPASCVDYSTPPASVITI